MDDGRYDESGETSSRTKKKSAKKSTDQAEGEETRADRPSDTEPDVEEVEEDEDPLPTPERDPVEPPSSAVGGRLTGSLAQTSSVVFGGGEHCTFRITLKDVSVDITANEQGKPSSATVTATAVEEVLSSPCPNSAIAPHRQRFTMTSAESQRITLAPAPENRPPADLVVEGDFAVSSPTVRLSWHRNDYPAPLDWRVTAQVKLAK